jgi:hypothetical protein
MEDLYRHLLRMMKSEGLSIPQKRGIKTADLIAISRNRGFTPNAAEVLKQRYAAAVELSKGGQWPAAMTELHEVWTQRVRVLGEHHQDTLRTGQFLAQATGATGNPVEAAESLTKILNEQTRQFGSDHQDTLRSRQFLAVSMGEMGRRNEAVAMLRALLPDRRRILGAEHDEVMRTQHVLARYLALSGVFDEAVALLKEIISTRKRLLGTEHEDTECARRDLEDVQRRRQDLASISQGSSLAEAESVV